MQHRRPTPALPPPLLPERLYLLILGACVLSACMRALAIAWVEPAAGELTAVELAASAPPAVLELGPGIAYEPCPSTGSAAWVAELVTADTLAGEARRANRFRADANLPAALRARDADYRASGYDRGHLAAAGNQGDQAARDATFTLANVVPQHPAVNRGPMRVLETSLRELVDARTSLVIVTAPLYELDAPKRTAGRLPVPTAFVKAVLVLQGGRPAEARAYRIENTAGAGIRMLTVDDVETLLQRDLFAWLPDDVEAHLESGADTQATLKSSPHSRP